MHDNNIPSGESIVRQYLLSKSYFRESLGYDVTTGWGLDTFGHNAQMPQILKLAGMKSYWFQRGVPGIETPSGKVIRMVGWFAGGLWCYEVARWLLLLYGRNTAELPPLLWGGVFFVGLEFVVHALLQAGGKPNFYTGQPQTTETTAVR